MTRYGHGTRAAYAVEGCRCDPCKQASREYNLAYKARIAANPLPAVERDGLFGDPRLPDVFWRKVRRDETGCWIWTGCTNRKGYGNYGRGDTSLAHRIVYRTLVGPFPNDLTIDHLCRVKPCCNPAHLEPVTSGENTRRALRLITHCPQGHPYDESNTVLRDGRFRFCRTCINARSREWRRTNIPRKPRVVVPGHELVGNGTIHRLPSECCASTAATEGHAKCACGSTSPHLAGKRERQRWHRSHKLAVRTADLEVAA